MLQRTAGPASRVLFFRTYVPSRHHNKAWFWAGSDALAAVADVKQCSPCVWASGPMCGVELSST